MDNRRNDNITGGAVMRFDVVSTLFALMGAALIGWGISLIPKMEEIKTLVWILAGVSSAIYLLCHANAGGSRSAIIIKYTSWTTLIVSNITLGLMSIWCQTSQYFILVASGIVLAFCAITYGVAKADQ